MVGSELWRRDDVQSVGGAAVNRPVTSTVSSRSQRRGQKPGGPVPDRQDKSPRLALPRHSIRITAGELMSDVELVVEHRVVAETTLARDVTRKSADVGHFVRGFFHAPRP